MREPKSVLEDVARLERENASLRARVEAARARDALEDTVRTRAATAPGLRAAAAVSFGVAFGLVMLVITMLMMPTTSSRASHGFDARDVRGGSAGVCR